VAGKQVVDIEATGKKEAPKDARFLGETDNVVERETVSRFARKDFDRTLAQPSQAQVAAPVPPSPGSSGSEGARAEAARAGGGAAQEGAPGPAAPGAPGGSGLRPGAPGARHLARLDPAARPDPGTDTTVTLGGDGVARSFRPHAAPPQGTASPQARGEGGEGGLGGADLLHGEGGGGGTAPRRSGSGPPVLSPSAAFYDKLGGGPFADHIQGVDVGDATVLNTRAWAFAGYMNRVKAAVAYAWDPEPEMHARDPRGDRFFYKERATVLSVTLDDRGGLREARVLQSSGLDFLDEIAVQAFQKAQPFHNPPAALVPEGTFSFAFTFFVGRAPR
jgi:TonB family protein